MNLDLYSKLASAWKEKDIKSLELISLQLLKNNYNTESKIIEAFTLSIAGKLDDALQCYQSIEGTASNNLINAIYKIDLKYCTTKLQRKSPKISIFNRLSTILYIFLTQNSELSRMIIHHGLYTWYITAFWYNHLESLLSSLLLFGFGILTDKPEARTHGKFLFGHLANVKGYSCVGVPLVRSAYKKRREILPWIEVPFLSYMAYGLYMVGRAQDIIPSILDESKKALLRYPDPFYQILLYVSILRFASQVGDIETSEDVASKLIKFAELTNAHRFYFSSKADLALCYGIRGLYWRCDEILSNLEEYKEDDADSVEAGSFYRLRGWAYFFVGKYQSALNDAEKSLVHFSKSKSFYMAKAMSEILREISHFRIELDKSNLIEKSIKITGSHSRRLKAFKRKYSKNPILIKMIAEEETALVASFGRFWQPGYSRDKNVISCQQRLHFRLNEITLSSTDELAWVVIMNEISAPLCVIFESRVTLNKKPNFEVRSTSGNIPGIEITIDRLNSTKTNYDLIKLSIINGSNLLSVLDAIYTLLPTLNCLFKIRDQQSFILTAERDKTLSLIASQVAHDIRSPLSALTMISASLNELPEEKRLIIRNASKRINDIANQLLLRAKESHEKIIGIKNPTTKIELLSAVIDVLVSEKRMQYRDNLKIEIEAELQNSYGLFANIEPTEIKIVLSNLINNSVESFCDQSGHITVGIESYDDSIQLFVKDNGCGIDPYILKQLGTQGISHGKEDLPNSGNGLGIYHAKKTIEALKGQLIIESQLGIGTKVSLLFKKSMPPIWFASTLTLEGKTKIVCVDDDVSIHNIWDKKFENLKLDSNSDLIHLSSGDNLEKWIKEHPNDIDNTLFLMDYEFLGHPLSGLDLIEKFKLENKAILVTSRFEELSIQEKCTKVGVKLIPKGMASLVPIYKSHINKYYDACLIDDDHLIRMTWELSAKNYKKSILTFDSYESFCSKAKSIENQTPIYVDVNLGNGVIGTDIAIKLYNMGYKNIYLTTGYEPSEIDNIPSFVTAVRGKDPLFTQRRITIDSNHFNYEEIT